ncbi:MAG: CoA transferase [Acidimicrobiaceae bacterium]|nr:CoA transferase [Acidimicrobiaceae bacterium]MYL04030.1 CoA transferase [Acidimicrobiaceae bacterium]
MAGPLEGIRVVELGVWVAGPAAGGILADWGADVVKVEPTGGDPGRMFQFILGGDMFSNPVFQMDNRGKRSIALDLTTDDGYAVMDELLAGADVFVTNVRLGGLDRLRLDHASVTARHRRLVYASVTGYGLEGAEASSGAFDVAGFWARSGIAHLLTPDGGDPPFQRGGMGDHSTGLAAAAGVCAALLARERTGEGQVVSTSLLRQGAYTISFDLSITLGWGLTLQIGQRDNMGNPAMNNYTAGDGRRFWLVGLEPERHWAPLARAVGRPDWLEHEHYGTARGRRHNAASLVVELDEIFATKSLDEWAEIFAAEPELFWAPIQSPDDLLADPQFAAAGGLVDVPDGTSTSTMVATPVDFSETAWAPRSIAPGLGEHSEEILRSLGRSEAEIEALVAAGAVRLPSSR